MKIGIVGRTNVGKSTLFNDLVGTYRAIVTDLHGTTREIVSDVAQIDEGRYALVLDSPGLADFTQELVYINNIIQDADIILFVVDGKTGVVSKDQQIKDLIIKHNKKSKTILVVNKLESAIAKDQVHTHMSDFHSMGFDEVVGVSAKQNQGIKLLLQKVSTKGMENGISRESEDAKDRINIPFAIMGRPNVGKSTLLNKLAAQEVARVEDVHGTTLDYLTADIVYKSKNFRLYDTAGIRRKGKIHGLERIAWDKTKKLLNYATPVCVILIDAQEGITHRDMSLVGEIIQLNLPILIAINKIDLLNREEQRKLEKRTMLMFDFAKWVPIVSISAKNADGLPMLMDWVLKLHTEYSRRISTGKLNKVLGDAWIKTPPRFPKNKICKFYYATQVSAGPPKFMISINNKNYANFSFKKWLDNVIRKAFGFVGIPLIFSFKEKEG